MSQALSRVFRGTSVISRLIIFAIILMAALFKLLNVEIPMPAQILLAIVALAIGIPHGAIDHLITIPRTSQRKFALFIFVYTLIAVLAGIAISTWSQVGFQVVVLMSALHFGFGDAAFFNESERSSGRPGITFPLLITYALPAGFLPVVLPLTDLRTKDVLTQLNPTLLNWSGSFTELIRVLTFVSALIAILILIIYKNYSLGIDLALLAALSTLAPPLIAFAIYFGGWHAIRHTARLVPKLPAAMQKVEIGSSFAAFTAAVKPGLYAIAGIFLLGIIVVASGTGNLTNNFLWSILVIIWALTVPHMATTSRFDLAVFKRPLRP